MEFRFREFLVAEDNTVGTHNDGPGGGFHRHGGAYLTADQTGSQPAPASPPDSPLGVDLATAVGNLRFPSLDFGFPSDIPVVTVRSKIAAIRDKQNPIMVQLEDGSRFYLSYDQFRRIPGSPAVGNVVTVELQRHPADRSHQSLSKVKSIRVG